MAEIALNNFAERQGCGIDLIVVLTERKAGKFV
jgi:hypothetical protein